MYATVTQTKSDGTTETMVKNYPIRAKGDLETVLDEARKVSVINDGVVFPPDVVRRDIVLTDVRLD
ncbi:hypothetical protein [Burkholderia ubonensis]|uniref:hypothetical protein n=1 Tax=Burkholderia ubonensis TaxID=101571 RepID=UPI000AD57A91|nr:hypothetical protein [Burkholderia ubonensis]